MSIDTATTFFALLALAVAVFVIVVLSFAVSSSLRRSMLANVGPVAFPGAVAVAVTSMAGSLYLSEVAHFTPCTLCWYQRIAMYSAAVIVSLALVRRDRSVHPYVIVLCVIGALISTYHVLIERFPSLESSASCEATNPCSLKWVEKFGFVTIPVMALTGFIGIITLLTMDRSASRFADAPTETRPASESQPV